LSSAKPNIGKNKATRGQKGPHNIEIFLLAVALRIENRQSIRKRRKHKRSMN